MKVLLFLILLVLVSADKRPQEKPAATKIWEWFDDNMPPAFRPIWREANEVVREMQDRKT